MNGTTLRHLAGVADLARIDIEAAALTLRAEGGHISAGYAGAYARGVRHSEAEVEDFSISVNASRFKAIAALFSDEDSVSLKYEPKALRLRSKTSDALIWRWGEESDYPEVNPATLDMAARLPAIDLAAEIEAAAEFTAESVLRPIFTGLHITISDGAIAFTAHDGGSVLFESEVKAKTKGTGELTAPTQDIILGARLVASGDAIIAREREALYIYSKQAVFRSSIITLPWPDSEPIKGVQTSTSFKIDAGQIRNLIAGGKALASGPAIEVTQQRKAVVFKVEGEYGGFATAVRGTIPEGGFRYDADAIGKLVRLGPVLHFSLPARPGDPTLVEADHRRCWVFSRG